MRQLIAFALLVLAFTSCEKKEMDFMPTETKAVPQQPPPLSDDDFDMLILWPSTDEDLRPHVAYLRWVHGKDLHFIVMSCTDPGRLRKGEALYQLYNDPRLRGAKIISNPKF